ncbi:MAG: glycosyltransferase family 2 protein [Candidatus Sericytochromatia bacterium]|nr:glycosyltransferase family 2 protein [Candidatus Sericytochromatia bacterium]
MLLPVSVCILVKDSENFLQKCLKSIFDIFAEIIIIDTGSTDNSLNIASQFTNKIYHYQWDHNFSNARNYGIQYVTQPWILWLDSDEEFIINDLEKFSDLLNSGFDSFSLCIENILNAKARSTVVVFRLLRTAKNYKYTGIIHEVPEIEMNKNQEINPEISYIKHYGYNSDYVDMEQKNKRNLSILQQAVQLVDKSSWTYIYNLIYLVREISNIGSNISNNTEIPNIQQKVNKLYEIEELINKYSITEIRNHIVVINFYQEIIHTFSYLQIFELEEYYCLTALNIFSNDLNLLSMTGECYFKKGEYYKSIILFKRIINFVKNHGYINGPIAEGLKSYGTLYNIAICYHKINDIANTAKYLKLSQKINPNFEPTKRLIERIQN